MPPRKERDTNKALLASDETKVCRTCKRERPIADYQYPRHRTCMACRIRMQEKSMVYHLTQATLPERKPPGLTSSHEGWLKYMRERYRAEHMTNDREPPLHLPRVKWCRRCRQHKPVREFENYRVRICMACDGPTAPWTVPT